MTADFFGATLTVRTNSRRKSDYGKEARVQEASSGKGEGKACRQEERREEESPAGEGQGQESRQSGESCEEGRQGCAQEGQSQTRRQESCAQAERAQANHGPAESPCAADSGADGNTACDASLGDVDDASQYGTVGVLNIR